MKFFVDCQSEKEVKDLYRKLAKLFHPDKGGDKELMISLQKQYDEWGSVQPAQYTGFSFNTIKSTSYHLPFDHPVHEEIRNLNIRIKQLQESIEIYRKKQYELSALLVTERDIKYHQILLMDNLRLQIETLVDSYPKNIWQYLLKKRMGWPSILKKIMEKCEKPS